MKSTTLSVEHIPIPITISKETKFLIKNKILLESTIIKIKNSPNIGSKP